VNARGTAQVARAAKEVGYSKALIYEKRRIIGSYGF